MKYVDEFRDKQIVDTLLAQIRKYSQKNIRLMEVCGGHTMSIHRFGIPSLLPETVTLLSGPGCPVCVTDQSYIDRAVAYSKLQDVVVATFGDLVRVPGSTSTLAKEKARGADVRMVYSPNDVLRMAKQEPHKRFIFLGIGFETTSPAIAASVKRAKAENLTNYFVYSAHKLMPPAMTALITEGIKIDGYICPGHVSVITGSSIYNDFPEKYGVSAVISGFEPVDLLQSILMSVVQLAENMPKVEIQYTRVVQPQGNLEAQAVLKEVFTPRDDLWRGLGILPASGLALSTKYENYDAQKMIEVQVEPLKVQKGCICGEILKGLRTPIECTLFKKVCNPSNPVGACMVSNEGACAAFYKYG